MKERSLFKLLFGFSSPVTRSTYVTTGFSLMLVKYAIEWVVAGYVLKKFYPVSAFLLPFFSYREEFLGSASAPFLLFLVFFSLPFMWIGVSMSVRRAVDAGFSPAMGLLFLIPLFNFIAMALLACLPSVTYDQNLGTAKRGEGERFDVDTDAVERLRAALLAIVAGALICLPAVYFAAGQHANYGAVLFLGLPTFMGTVASWIWNRSGVRSVSSSIGVAWSALFFGGLFLLLFAFEGIICLVMAAPFAFVGAFLGAYVGRFFATVRPHSSIQLHTFGLLALFALGNYFADGNQGTPLRAVTTEQIIAAPAEVVWRNVVEFAELPAPEEMIFRSGIAYPIRARIEGRGVGAMRYCEFSTGAFVEPITVWDPPYTLGFDVTEQPKTMSELSLYRELEPRHLRETFSSKRGQFELIPLPDGTTLLRGTTWYTLAMSPQPYWNLWSDYLIHQIHGRVLRHIRQLSESNALLVG